MLGDPLPAALATYFGAIDACRFDDAAETFAPDGLYAVALPGTGETAPRVATIGPTAVRDRFVERGPKPWRHVVQLCVADAGAVLVEGVLVEGGKTPTATFIASAALDGGGHLRRYLAFSCPGPLDPIPTEVPISNRPADATSVVNDYFTDLDRGDFEAAASHFSADVLYSHPPYQHTGITDPHRLEFRGRAQLLAAFERRGKASFDHEVLVSIQRGPHSLFEGSVGGLPGERTGSFVSSLSLAADGTIRRYVSFYCEPGVPMP